MAKVKTAYICAECGYESAKWMGKCPSCNSWNSLNEEIVGGNNLKSSPKLGNKITPVSLASISEQKFDRIDTKDAELNRVLGGGVVPASVVLIGGEPGIGKSTLMLQLSLLISQKALYVSGEESLDQLKLRATRLGLENKETLFLAHNIVGDIIKACKESSPGVVIIDSIQTLHSYDIDSPAGTVSQIKQCTAELIHYAKKNRVPIFIVGHITKEGSIAGPKTLEHMVDTVLQFEGDRHLTYRIVRTIKNRFGSTSELGIYEMTGKGLREVSNPSEILLSQRDDAATGISIGAMMEGNRPLMIEVQALVSSAIYGNPQRSSTGYDAKRMNMLLAVLEKRCGMRFGDQDVFLNIAGGIKVDDPALDLAVAVALVSSLEEIPISEKIGFCAEVGLAGELRSVNKLDQRIAEAEKLGFEQIIVSKYGLKGIDVHKYGVKIVALGKIKEAISFMFA